MPPITKTKNPTEKELVIQSDFELMLAKSNLSVEDFIDEMATLLVEQVLEEQENKVSNNE